MLDTNFLLGVTPIQKYILTMLYKRIKMFGCVTLILFECVE